MAITAHAMQGYAERCMAAGMNDDLTQPLQFAQVVATLQRVCG